MNIPLLSNETITREQLNRALSFDVYRHVGTRNSLTQIVNFLFFNEILKYKENIIKNRKAKSKYMDAIRQVILNLYVAYLCHISIKYPRSTQKYRHDFRYGKLWFKHRTLIPLIDILERLGYLEQRIGFFNRTRKKGKESRMWATGKLLDLFQHTRERHLISKEQPTEIIQLKDEDKSLVPYRDTRSTDRMRNRLKKYNDFISKQEVAVKLGHKLLNVNFLYALRNWTNTSMCEILEHENPEIVIRELIFNHDTPKPIITKSQTDILNLNIQSQTSIPNLNTHVPHHQYYKPISIPLLTQKEDKSFNDGHFGDQKIMWNEFENRLYFRASKLVIGLRYNFIHRVFNNGKFSLGGRFYGAVHQQLSSAYRKHIFINDNPTIELDYSGLHIRMLYHLEGVDFRKDPYEGVDFSEDPYEIEKERKKFKTVQLILINAEDRKKAVRGIRKELSDMGYRSGLMDEDIEGLIETFVSLHPTISKFLHSGKGLKLQNMDSRIMDDILTNLTNLGIPALPVHDSVIVEKQYEEELKYQMVNCYKKEMGFEPIIH